MEEIKINWGNTKYKASWGTFKLNADAEKVAREIESLGDRVTPQRIVDYAKDENTELHGLLEWDDSIAANKHRLQQAREIVGNLKITILHEDKEDEPTPIRYFSMSERKNGAYQKTEVIVRNPDEYALLLQHAKEDLQIFRNKYRRLSELEEVFEAIDRL